jgi:hypothetical protein
MLPTYLVLRGLNARPFQLVETAGSTMSESVSGVDVNIGSFRHHIPDGWMKGNNYQTVTSLVD